MRFPIKVYRVAEQSMEPTVPEGSYAVVNRWSSRFARGDIIVLRSPEDGLALIKRIDRFIGDRIFALGDNKAKSRDSRTFGAVRKQDIIGKVLFVL